MPYEIRRFGIGYKVFKKGTNKTFSKSPMSLLKAQHQMIALILSEITKNH
jgi:hypothetical protein